MSIAKRLFLLIGFLVLALISVGAVAVWQIDNISDDIEYESDQLLPAVEFSGTIAHRYLLLRISVLTMLNATEPQRIAQLTQQIFLQQKELDGLLLEYQSTYALDKTDNELPRECRRLRILAVVATGDLKNGKRKHDNELAWDATFGRGAGAVGTAGVRT